MKHTPHHSQAAHRPNRARVSGGFTVVEMLIVVAIIGILAALIFPVFKSARERGRQTSCMSNLKQLGLAFQQYAEDSNRRYPGSGNYYVPTTPPWFAGMPNGWGVGKGHWVAGQPGNALADSSDKPTGNTASPEDGAIYSYVKSPQVYVCPSNRDGRTKRLSYSMNCALTGISNVRIRTPAEIVLLVDEEYANDGYFFAVDDAAANSTGTNSTDALTKLHNGGGNLLFCDGHVKFYSARNFPLDGTPEGKTNKWRDTGSPRFHDRAFGPRGSNSAPKSPPPPAVQYVVADYCNALLP